MRDAINLIPYFGLVNNPEQRRSALLNKLDAIDKMTAVNNTFGAKRKLQNDFRDKIEKWLADYTQPTISVLNKTQTLSLVDNTIVRLSLMGK